MKLVKKHGMRNWARVTAELGSRRSLFQCIAHYQKALNPDFLKRLVCVRTMWSVVGELCVYLKDGMDSSVILFCYNNHV